MIINSNFIPLEMYRSVKRSNTMQKRHPVRDASLTGCAGKNTCPFSTERHIPNGMSKTVICFFFPLPKNKQIRERKGCVQFSTEGTFGE